MLQENGQSGDWVHLVQKKPRLGTYLVEIDVLTLKRGHITSRFCGNYMTRQAALIAVSM